MHEQIIIRLQPTELNHIVYIMSNNTEIVPLTIECTKDELMSTVAMSAAKYKINEIKLQGPHDYTAGIRDQLMAKVSTCFGADNSITIELI